MGYDLPAGVAVFSLDVANNLVAIVESGSLQFPRQDGTPATALLRAFHLDRGKWRSRQYEPGLSSVLRSSTW